MNQLLYKEIKVGLEAVHIMVQTGKTITFEFDQSKDTANIKLGHTLEF
jgi:hypothetical protein